MLGGEENNQRVWFPGFWAWWYGLPIGVVQDPQGNEALRTLRKAIIGRKEKTVRTLLGIGVNVNASGEDQYTPLHLTASYGHEGIVRMLIEAGADVRAVDVNQRTPLYIAALHGHEGVARMLAEAGADLRAVDRDQYTPLHLTASYGHEGVARVLVEAGADVRAVDRDQRTPLHLTVWKGKEGIVRLLMAGGADLRAFDRDGKTPLYLAADSDHEEVARLLVEKGADVYTTDKHGNLLLLDLVRGNKVGMLGVFVNGGANVNMEKCGRMKKTLLQYAVFSCRVDTVRLLVEAGADTGVVNPHLETLLHIAARTGNEGVARLLIEVGADVRAVDMNQCTPLHLAAEGGHEGAARVLVEAGADVRAVDVNQRTPLHIAAFHGYEVVARMLVEAGAYIICTRTQRVPLRDGGRLVAMAVDLPDGSNWIAGDGTSLEGAMSTDAFDYYLANLRIRIVSPKALIQQGGALVVDPGDGTHPMIEGWLIGKVVIRKASVLDGSCGWVTLKILAQWLRMGEKDFAAMLLPPSYPGGPSHAVAVKGFPSVLSITDKQPELPSDDDANKVFPEEDHEEPMNDGIGRSFMKAMYAVNYICKVEEAERKLEMAWHLPTPENRLQAVMGLGGLVVYGLAGVTLGGIDVAVVTPVMQIGSALGRGDTSPEATEQLRASAVTLTACTLAGFGVPGAIFVCMSGMVVSTMLYVDSAIRQRASWEQEKRSPGFNLDSVVAREDLKAEMTSLLGKAACFFGLISTEVSGDSNEETQIGDIGAGIEVAGIAPMLGGMSSYASGEVPVIDGGIDMQELTA